MARPACETGYVCDGCGQQYDRDPAGSDAWWFTCVDCGGEARPVTKAEAGRLFA